MQNCHRKEQRAGETQRETECNSAGVISILGKEGSGMIKIFLAAKDREAGGSFFLSSAALKGRI